MPTKLLMLSLIISSLTVQVFAQDSDSTTVLHKAIVTSADSTKSNFYLSGSALLTNNGINLVPTFSLNKPAAMFKFFAGNRLTFEPEFNFSLEGKPWYFIFWIRYKLIQTEKFRLSTAGQYGLNYLETDVLINGNTVKGIVAQRYLALDIAPSYQLTKNLGVGIYYLHSHGVDPGTTNSLDFLTLNATWNIEIAKMFQFTIAPQLYYLHQDDRHGTYITTAFNIQKKRLPLALSFIINQPLKTDIAGGQDFVWNVSLVYLFEVIHPKK
jgi:hypothetical protein